MKQSQGFAKTGLDTVWSILDRPLQHIQNSDELRTAQRLSRLTLSLITIALVLILLPKNLFLGIPNSVSIAVSIGALFMIISFLLNRTPFYRLAPHVFVFSVNATIYGAYIAYPPSVPERILNYLLLVVFISSRLFGTRTTLLIIITNTIALFCLPLFVSSDYSLDATITFFLAVSVIVYVLNRSRQQDIQRLKDSEARYRNLMEANYEPLAIVDTDGKILDVNPAFERLSGYTSQQLSGRNIMDMATSASFGMITRYQDYEFSVPIRIRATTASGNVIPIEIRSRRYTYQNKPSFVVVARDLSYETEIERQKREYELRYKALFENMNDAVYILDLGGKNLSSNEHGLRMLGFTMDEFLQRSLRDTVVMDEVKESYDVITQLLNGQTVPVYSRHFRRKNGETFPAEVSAMLVRDMDDTPLYIQSVVRDLSERQRMENHRLELALQRERNDVLKQLIDDFSHHVRTPLANIKNSRYLIEKYRENYTKQDQHFGVIDIEVERMVNLLDDLLMLTRIEPENDILTIQPIDVNELAREMLPFPAGLSPEDSQHTWHFEPIPDSVWVYGNRGRLQEALRRLLFNARRYTPSGGTITVRLRNFVRQKTVCLSIIDTGIGIAEADLPHIFQNFFRSDAARHLHPNSSGLGLCICKKIVDIHRGAIDVHSTLGEGSTFSIWLPTDMMTIVDDDLVRATQEISSVVSE